LRQAGRGRVGQYIAGLIFTGYDLSSDGLFSFLESNSDSADDGSVGSLHWNGRGKSAKR
jgi:hypothetical protein